MIRQAIIKLANKRDLTFEEADQTMKEIMTGQATPVQISSFLTALSMKGETADEIVGLASRLRATGVRLLHNVDALEIVGTGGNQSNSFNISTPAALIISAGGVPVAQHGNRSVAKTSETADCLEALGVNIMISPEKSTKLLEEIGICFLFEKTYQASMKHVTPVYRELGIHTVFDILGPLTNPAGASMQLMGVYDENLVKPLAQVMAKLGVKSGMVVYGQDRRDEISMCAPTSVCEIRNGWFTAYEIKPEDFGYERCDRSEISGGTAEENARITRGILEGSLKGPKRNTVCMNAGAALYIGGRAGSVAEGIRMAENLIDSGAALAKLEEFIERSNR